MNNLISNLICYIHYFGQYFGLFDLGKKRAVNPKSNKPNNNIFMFLGFE